MAAAGADGIVVETMTDPAEARLAVAAAKETGLPVVACMTFDSGAKLDRTMMGTTPEQAAEQLLDAGADVIGSNCGQGVAGFVEICRRLHAASGRAVWVKANAGLPEMRDGKTHYAQTAEQFAAYVPATRCRRRRVHWRMLRHVAGVHSRGLREVAGLIMTKEEKMTDEKLPQVGGGGFEDLKKVNDYDAEYWSARDLQPLLGYSQWRRFENAVKKAITSCEQSGNDPNHHFASAGKPIPGGKGAVQVVPDYHLSRFACYLIAQNGDPRKPEIANAETRIGRPRCQRADRRSA